MERLTNEKMKKVKGGEINWGLISGIGALASFIFGVIDGLMNPKKCNN